ncbi:MAG: alpha/beta hydrolase [Hyphomicrobiales bacterium]|nr:alpha/beta hydrolase [Hyphomicrobiales bacterium]
MGLDPRARRFLDFLAASARRRDAAPNLDDLRRASADLAAFAGLALPVDRRDERLDGGESALTLRIYSPVGAGAALPALLYFHGGGWVSGGIETHDAICAGLAARGGCRIVAVAYRLAPEHRFPAALDDAIAALRAVRADPARFGVDAGRLGVGGDSAGANLGVALARAVRGEAAPLALQLLLCPVMEPLGRTPSRRDLAAGYLIEEATMRRYWDLYRIEGLAADDPRVAPLRASDLPDMPSALIHTAEFDPLRDEGELYADALVRDGVAARLTRHAGMIHHFYGLGGAIPAAAAAFDKVGEQLRAAWI